MDSKLTNELIAEAKKYLKENPQDLLHDIEHHQRVLSLAMQIIEEEGLENDINKDLVEIICWWHDVKVPKLTDTSDKRVAEITAEYLSKKLPVELQEITFDSVKNHEFGSKPSYIEGKILQDADKLEVLSLERANNVMPMLEKGQKTKVELRAIFDMVTKKWLPIMPELYHFPFSKKYHQEHVKAAISKFEEIRKNLET